MMNNEIKSKSEVKINKHKKVIIIGGGIAGLSTAVYLADEGFDVTCLEANDEVARETSFMNGGLMCASLTLPWCTIGNIISFFKENISFVPPAERSIAVRWSAVIWDRRFYEWCLHYALNAFFSNRIEELFKASYALSNYSLYCLEELHKSTNAPFPSYRHGTATGTLQLFQNNSDRCRHYERISGIVPNVESYSADETCKRFNGSYVLQDPAAFRGGVLYQHEDRACDIHSLCLALQAHATSKGVRILTNHSVTGLLIDHKNEQKRIKEVVLANGDTITADIFVAANGNGSNAIAAMAGDGQWHSWPVKGYAIEVPINTEINDYALPQNIVDDVNRVYIAPVSNRSVRLSGYCEFGDIHAHHRSSSASQYTIQDHAIMNTLFKQAQTLLPHGFLRADGFFEDIIKEGNPKCSTQSASGVEQVKIHSCWRPQTPDDLPVIGQSSVVQNLFYNSGHGHLGLTRAIGSSKLLKDIITGQENKYFPPSMSNLFAPSRFKQILPLLRRVLR